MILALAIVGMLSILFGLFCLAMIFMVCRDDARAHREQRSEQLQMIRRAAILLEARRIVHEMRKTA